MSELISASRDGDIEAVKALLAEGVDVNAKDESEWTALMHAATSGHVSIVELLVKEGADLYETNDDEETALEIALDEGHSDVADILEASYDNDLDERTCPFCSEPVEDGCSHFIGWGYDYDEGDFEAQFDFAEKAYELTYLIRDFNEEAYKNALSNAPQELRELFEAMRARGFYYWKEYSGVDSIRWENEGGPGNSWTGHYYFHEDAEAFASGLKKEAKRGSAWLKEI
jgi:ankyrin repeat protein